MLDYKAIILVFSIKKARVLSKSLFLFLGLLFSFSSQVNAQLIWDKTYGGSSSEWGSVIVPALDEGFLLGGGGNTSELIKITEDGLMQWKKNYLPGGISSIAITADSNYLLGINTTNDFYLVKIDINGAVLWEKEFLGVGGYYLSYAHILNTLDGGFILTGVRLSIIDSQNYVIYSDMMVMKIDANGNLEWEKVYGLPGDNEEYALMALPTADGNYYIFGTDILKIDPMGNKIWEKTPPFSISTVMRTGDGGYLLGGGGGIDYRLAKLNADAYLQWEKTYTGNNLDVMVDIIQTSLDRLLLIGFSYSSAGYDKSSPNMGEETDIWIVMTDNSGNQLYDITIGGNSYDKPSSAVIVPEKKVEPGGSKDSVYILGTSYSPASGNKTSPNLGGGDFWLVNLEFNTDTNVVAKPIIIDWILTCRFCDIWGYPWEDIIDIEYRIWLTDLGVENATHRLAFDGDHRDLAYWENNTDLIIEFYPDLPPGEYQFQMRGILNGRTSTEWTVPISFEIKGGNVQVFPNPVNNVLNIAYQALRKELVEVNISDQMGQVLLKQNFNATEGINEWTIDLGRLRHELLILRILSNQQGPYTKRLLRK